MKNILVMEFDNIKADIRPDLPYDLTLQECLFVKNDALNKGNIDIAGNASRGIAECYRRLGQIDKAVREYKFALNFFQESKNVEGIARTKWTAANIFRQQCDYINSINLLKDAYKLSFITKDHSCTAYSLAGIAETTRILGNYKVSFIQHLNALNLFKLLRDYRGIVWAYEGIAQMYKNSGLINEGLSLFSISKNITEETRDMRGLGYALKGIGEILGIMGSYKESINNLKIALVIFKKINFRLGIAYTRKTLGEIYLKYSNFNNALENFNKAFKMFEELKDQRGIAYTNKSFGDFHKKLGFFKEAKECYLKSQVFFRSKNVTYGFVISSIELRKLGVNNNNMIIN